MSMSAEIVNHLRKPGREVLDERTVLSGSAAPPLPAQEGPVKTSEVPTIKTKRSRVILVVGFGDAFVRRCREAAVDTEATIKGVEAGDEAGRALQGLPLAVVMQRDTIRTSLLATVAREIGVGLLAVPGEHVTDARLKELIEGALAAAQARSRSR